MHTSSLIIVVVATLLLLGSVNANMDDMLNYLKHKKTMYSICNNMNRDQCMSEYQRNYPWIENIINVVYFSIFEPTEKVYILFYLAWLDHLLNDMNSSAEGNFNCTTDFCSSTDLPNTIFHHLIIQITGRFSSDELLLYISETIAKMPPRSIFVIMNCSPSYPYYNPLSIIGARRLAGIDKSNVLLHLNHEQPGSDINDPTHLEPNHCYGDNEQLLALYSNYNLVIRNYYYEPFSSRSIYLPLGPSCYHMIIGLNQYPNYAIKPASKRQQRCFYAGRAKYSHSGPHQVERAEIVQLKESDQFPCDYRFFEEVGMDYMEYQKLLRGAVFAPSPAGNSYETYRLYEALEVQCIPVIIRPREEKSNFLLTAEWSDYPGPVLRSWSELGTYLEGLYPSNQSLSLSIDQGMALDNLQKQIYDWYSNMKRRKGIQLRETISNIFNT